MVQTRFVLMLLWKVMELEVKSLSNRSIGRQKKKRMDMKQQQKWSLGRNVRHKMRKLRMLLMLILMVF